MSALLWIFFLDSLVVTKKSSDPNFLGSTSLNPRNWSSIVPPTCRAGSQWQGLLAKEFHTSKSICKKTNHSYLWDLWVLPSTQKQEVTSSKNKSKPTKINWIHNEKITAKPETLLLSLKKPRHFPQKPPWPPPSCVATRGDTGLEGLSKVPRSDNFKCIRPIPRWYTTIQGGK